jgi:acyl-ACP thioesterase
MPVAADIVEPWFRSRRRAPWLEGVLTDLPAMTAFVPDPGEGRLFTSTRPVRATDATPGGRLRLDAIARFLQDVAEDDVTDSGWDEPYIWLLRRCELVLASYPLLGGEVTLRTYCSATGPRWAERTTTLSAKDGDLIQAKALWVAVAGDTGAPAPLSAEFHRVYGPSAQGRTVSARLYHPAPDPGLGSRPWPLRSADFDSARHVNNSVHWIAVEDAMATAVPDQEWLPATAEIEYRQPIIPGCQPALVMQASPGRHLAAWLMDGPDVLASARLAS